MKTNHTIQEAMMETGNKDFFSKPGKIPEILPLGYVYPNFSQGKLDQFDSPDKKGKNRSPSANHRHQRSKSDERLDICDHNLRFKVDLILAKSKQKNRKKTKSPAKHSQSDTKRKPIDQLYHEFIHKSNYRLKRSEDLTRPLRMMTYRESVLQLLMQIMLTEEAIQTQTDEMKSKFASKEERFLAKENKLSQEIKAMNLKLDEVIEEAKKTVAEYESKLEKVSKENQSNLSAKLKVQEEILLMELSYKDKTAEMKKEIDLLSTENKQLKASVSHIDLKYIDLMTQKMAELEQTVDEEKMKAAINTQRHEQEMYDTQVELVKVKMQVKKMQNDKEDTDNLILEKNALIKKLHSDLLTAKNSTETKVIKDLKDRIIQLEKDIVLKEAEIVEVQRDAEQRQAKSKIAEIAVKNSLKQQIQTLKTEKERNEVQLKQELLNLSEQLIELKRKNKAGTTKSGQLANPQTGPVAENDSSTTNEELKVQKMKIELLEKKLKESDLLIRQQYEEELKANAERILSLEEQLNYLNLKMKSEEEKKLTLERVIMSMSAQSRLRRDSVVRPDAALSQSTTQVNLKVKESPFVQLLEKMRESKEKLQDLQSSDRSERKDSLP